MLLLTPTATPSCDTTAVQPDDAANGGQPWKGRIKNGANGMSDIDGKAAWGAATEPGGEGVIDEG
jgi:hypothetical protein